VTDSKNHYINGLKPGISASTRTAFPQKLATFAEGAKPPVAINADGTTTPRC
jgi:hypothetical protein